MTNFFGLNRMHVVAHVCIKEVSYNTHTLRMHFVSELLKFKNFATCNSEIFTVFRHFIVGVSCKSSLKLQVLG